MIKQQDIFHAGELAAQKRAGAGDMASLVAGFIRDYMPQQHRDFHSSLPFLVISAADEEGRPWVTFLEGAEGFVTSPDERTLALATEISPADPLASAINGGTDIGMLGIELATRRRNRLSGFIHPDGKGLAIDIRQTFGNCPQYIREREWHRVTDNTHGDPIIGDRLSQGQIAQIQSADTMFIGTGQQANAGEASSGYDASHRGGERGFVQIVDELHLRIPDYAGNNFFNTIGNLIENPRLGLLFIDFESGSMLHITGTAVIDWEPENALDPAARRMIDVTIDAVVERPSALALRWQSQTVGTRSLVVAEKTVESADITSLHLYPADRLPRDNFEAGQHLPVEMNIPGTPHRVRRSYSLSGSPTDDFYRLSIKRESHGLASRHVHDTLEVGDIVEAGRPSGDFVIPCAACPLVLISAGVGITPMLSMLHAVAADQSDRPVWFVHGARDSDHHALRNEVDKLIDAHQNLRKVIHYSQPLKSDNKGIDFDLPGRIMPEGLIGLGAGPDAHYMLCGPAAFLAKIQSGLEEGGVPGDQIHFETFGPSSQ
ncbi:MAG: hypothetical protein Pars92KO_04070 [Parasphingorhabdus sp.]